MKATTILIAFCFFSTINAAELTFSNDTTSSISNLRGLQSPNTSNISNATKMITTRIEGHRGAGHLAPENSIKAFEIAIELGLHGVETDVWLTKDRVPVVVHGLFGGLIKFTNGLSRRIGQIDAAELKNEEYILENGETIPTLAEVLDICKDKVRVNIEIKDRNPEVMEKTLEVVQEKGMIDQISFSSFNHNLRRDLTNLLERMNITTPVTFGFLVKYFDSKFPDYNEAQPGDSINVDVELLKMKHTMCRAELSKAAKQGLKVSFWFPMDFEEERPYYSYLMRLNADTIITNKPENMMKFLERKMKAIAQ